MSNQDAQRETIWKRIKGSHIAMLTTEDQGRLRSRPMGLCQNDFDDGCLWFFTRSDSPKAQQMDAEHQVNVSFTNVNDNNFASLSGRAERVDDPAAIDAHWNAMVKVWFPDGKDDPELQLLRVHVEQAQYWDAPSSRMVIAFDLLKARTTGKQPEMGESGKVDLS